MTDSAPAFVRADGLSYVVAESGQIYEVRPVSLTLNQIRAAVEAGLLIPDHDARQTFACCPAVGDRRPVRAASRFGAARLALLK